MSQVPRSLPPPAPPWLTPEAKEEWLRLAARLGSDLDTAALTLYCEAWSTWRHAVTKISEFGPVIRTKGGAAQSPYSQIANQSMGHMVRLLADLNAGRASRPPSGADGSSRRPYKFTEERKSAYLDLLRNGGRRHASARAVGISPWTVVNRMNADPKFAAAVERAEMEANEAVENALFEAALSGNVIAIQVWLYNRMAERWKDKRAAAAVAQAVAVSGDAEARATAGALADDDFYRIIETAYRQETGEEAPTFDNSGPDAEPPPALAPGPPADEA